MSRHKKSPFMISNHPLVVLIHNLRHFVIRLNYKTEYERQDSSPGRTKSDVLAKYKFWTMKITFNKQANPYAFSALLRKERIDRSRMLLADPSLSSLTVADIAAQSGLPDLKRFHRLFKQATRMTPGQYRAGPRQATERFNGTRSFAAACAILPGFAHNTT